MSISAAKLTERHFAATPVWRFLADDQPGIDESHVEPVPDAPGLGTHASFLVAARFCMSDGQQRPGAVQVDVLGRRVSCLPALLYVGDRSLDPLASDVGTRIARITHQPRSQPTAWTLAVAFAGETMPRRGRIARWHGLRAAGLLVKLWWLHRVVRRRG